MCMYILLLQENGHNRVYTPDVLCIISSLQENGHIKCHQYYPADDKPLDAPNFVQFDQVMINNNLFTDHLSYSQYRISSLFVNAGVVTTRGLMVKHIPSSKVSNNILYYYCVSYTAITRNAK